MTSECTISVPATAGSLHHAVSTLALLLSSINHTSDVVVCLEPGIHRLARPIQLGPQHNHGGRVIWRGHPSQTTTISGGAPLTKWTRCFDGVHCNDPEWNGCFAYDLEDVPNATQADAPFRQLWVGGKRAPRAVSDSQELGLTPSVNGYTAAMPASFYAAELRWPRQIKNWIEPRCVISNVSGAHLSVAPACWKALTARAGKRPPVPLLVENIVRPPPPGEFVSSKRYIFYRPRAAEPYAAPTDAWAPLLEVLINASGLSNHTFTNLTFAHATWRQPSQEGGYVPTQSAVTSLGEPLGAVRFAAATELIIDRCIFHNLGAAYALSVGDASHDVAIRRSTFDALAGGALKIGNVLGGRELTTDEREMDIGFEVTDNVLTNIALEFRGAAAIFAGYVALANISHNTILNTGYTGISLGWGWGSHVVGKQTYMRDNHIVANHITGVMSALNDGGCTYTLGPQPNSTVTANYCNADRAPVVGSFYHDNVPDRESHPDEIRSHHPWMDLLSCLHLAEGGAWIRFALW